MSASETFSLDAEALPQGASQNFKYKSLDNNVASVNANGIVTAKSKGSVAIIVSNEDLTAAVTVIVNNGVAKSEAQSDSQKAQGNSKSATPQGGESGVAKDALATKLMSGKAGIAVSVGEYPLVTSEALSMLYSQKKTFTANGEGYELIVYGADIVNTSNELRTDIDAQTSSQGFSFTLNEGKNLPGTVSLKILSSLPQGASLYLKNALSGRYEKLDVNPHETMRLDTPGEYLITAKSPDGFTFRPYMLIVAVAIILAAVIAFIAVRRRYWFW